MLSFFLISSLIICGSFWSFRLDFILYLGGPVVLLLALECRSYIIIEVTKLTRWQNQVACFFFCSQLRNFLTLKNICWKEKDEYVTKNTIYPFMEYVCQLFLQCPAFLPCFLWMLEKLSNISPTTRLKIQSFTKQITFGISVLLLAP